MDESGSACVEHKDTESMVLLAVTKTTRIFFITSGIQFQSSTPDVSSRDLTLHCLKTQGKLITPLAPPLRRHYLS